MGRFDRDRASLLAAKIKRSPRFAQLLINRGIDTPAKYMKWSLDCASSLYNPSSLPDIAEAVDLLVQAVNLDQLVFVCGDYDADGICATVIIVRALRALKVQAEYQLPLRAKDGYGLNRREIDKAAELGAQLLITVDCGSSNGEEVAYARQRGLKVIVTDHHKVPPLGPDADAFVNPQRPDSVYPEKNLCGAAVAWKLMAALYARLNRPVPLDLLDFVAFATITDMMSLTNENRLLCRLGLASIESWKRPSLRALGDICGVRSRTFNAKSVSYFMGPRINAVGRVDDPRFGAELMLSDDIAQCQKLAGYVEDCNLRRRQMQNEVVDTIKDRLDIAAAKRRGFIFEYGDWHIGVVGIAAGMLTNDYRLPCLVGRLEGECVIGSGRGTLGTDLHAVLQDCSDVLEHFGGHASAAGFAVQVSKLDAFLDKFSSALQKHRRPIPPLFVDYEMRLDEIEAGFISELKELEPTGQGAPPPCFLLRGVRFADLRSLKEGRYLTGSLWQGGGTKVKMTAFGCADDLKHHELLDQVCDVVGSLDISSFGGIDRICVNIDYALAADAVQLQRLDRDDGIAREVSAYSGGDFVPLPFCEQLPIAIAVPEEEKKRLLAEQDSGSVPRRPVPPASKTVPAVRHYLIDERGNSNLPEYLRGVIAKLQRLQAKTGPERLGVIAAFENSLPSLPADLAAQVTVLTWKKWLALENCPRFTDVFLADPPFDLEQLRRSGWLQRVVRLHLLFSESSWKAMESYVKAWSLSTGDMNHAWQRLLQWLNNYEGTYEFSLKDKQLAAICDISSSNLLWLAIKVMSEAMLITCDKTEQSAVISLISENCLPGARADWQNSQTFVRMDKWFKGFQNSRHVLEKRRAEPELFWQE